MLHLENFSLSEKPVVYEQRTTGLEGFLLTMHKSRLVIVKIS